MTPSELDQLNEKVARKLGNPLCEMVQVSSVSDDKWRCGMCGSVVLKGNPQHVQIKNYSRSIAAAWEIVEWMQSKGYEVPLTACPERGFHIAVTKEVDAPPGYRDDRLLANEAADTAPMVICKAFLKLP